MIRDEHKWEINGLKANLLQTKTCYLLVLNLCLLFVAKILRICCHVSLFPIAEFCFIFGVQPKSSRNDFWRPIDDDRKD